MGEDAREEGGERTRSWYLTREEIERDSPSRRDGVGAAKEAELRTTYSSFIRHVCIRLQLPHITRATAILLCHRFYLRQSHAKNEWQTIATVCVFLASKIEDTPCSLKSVVIVAYETMYQKNTDAAKRIHQEEVLAKQKALILVGETLLLSTIRFDFNIQHAYEPLELALNKLGISQKEVRQSAMSLINNTLPTTLVVQFEPHLIAAGSLLRAAKFHNIILPSQNGIVWRKVFDVDDFDENQLQAVIQQMTEIFEKRDPCSMGPIIKPVPTSTLTDKHQIKPTSTLSPTPINKKQIKPTSTLSPTPINKMQIKPTQTSIPTLTDKQQIKPAPTTTPMDKQHIKLIPAPTPTATDKQQIISTLDLRHTRSSRRSFRNSNTEARCVPVGSSLDNKFTGRSARYGENQYQRKCEENRYWRKYEENQYEENQYQRKYEENQYRINCEENQYRIKYEENQYRIKYEENQYRRKYWRCEENLYQRKHINHNLDTVVVDQRFELVKGMSGTLKAARGNEAGIRDLKKRRIQDVAGIPTPDYRYKCLEVREARYGGTNSSWRKQKVERR